MRAIFALYWHYERRAIHARPNILAARLTINSILYKPGLISLIASFALLVPASLHSAELPQLSSVATLSGAATSAVFRAGASTVDNSNFRNDFLASDAITIAAQFQVEPGHANLPGNLYIIVGHNGEYYMRTENGEFLPWDASLPSLLPAAAKSQLQSDEILTIVENIALGTLGLAGDSLSIYLAYSLNSDSQQLYYSVEPLVINIGDYDPLQISTSQLQTIDTVMVDSNRDREIPLLIFLPETSAPAPVILFSHGLGGSRTTAVYLGEHWSARGYLVVFMQHRGSDESILEGVAPSQIVSVMQAASSVENVLARISDVSAVIDQLELWNTDSNHELSQRMNLDRIGMSGHSFGARTTQTTSGEIIPWLSYSTREPRIKAAMPLSGSVPNLDTAAQVLGDVDIPWLIMTGTLDESLINDTTVADRLGVFPALPAGGKFELVLFEGEHHAFTDHPVTAIQNPRNPAHHPEIMALSTAFWDGWLLDDMSARRWLEGDGARAVLQPGDSWQFK